MKLCKVIGNLTSTVRETGYEERKILFVHPIKPDGKLYGKSFLAIDTIQAGVDDIVLVIEEGGSARICLKEDETYTVKSVIAGIVDNIQK